MTDEKRQLEVGDVIYAFKYGSTNFKMTVIRVTKTLAICQNPWNKDNELRFKRDDSKYITRIGQSMWHSISYKLATPELDKEFIIAKMRSRIKQVKWEHISEDILKEIYEILGYGAKK